MKYVTKNIVLELSDEMIVRGVVKKNGLGGHGFSAAIRLILREWFDFQPGDERIRITEAGRDALREQ